MIKRFGQKLYSLRVSRGFTLKELAQALGYTAHGHISELEAGKKQPSLEFVLKTARFFEVTTDQLLKDELDLNISDIPSNDKSQPS